MLDLFACLDYFNSDGTWETFCANGARCVGKILYDKKLIEDKAQFTAGDGEHQLKFDNPIWVFPRYWYPMFDKR